MKKSIFIIPLFIFSVACSSKVGLEAMKKQEEKAHDELISAQEELIELANMKEQYSVDSRDAKIQALEKRQKQISKDLKNLEDVETESAQDATSNITGSLEKKQAEIDEQIKALEGMTKENWEEAREAINKKIKSLQDEINTITANLDYSEE